MSSCRSCLRRQEPAPHLLRLRPVNLRSSPPTPSSRLRLTPANNCNPTSPQLEALQYSEQRRLDNLLQLVYVKIQRRILCLLSHQLDHRVQCTFVCVPGRVGNKRLWIGVECLCICTVGLSSVNAIIETKLYGGDKSGRSWFLQAPVCVHVGRLLLGPSLRWNAFSWTWQTWHLLQTERELVRFTSHKGQCDCQKRVIFLNEIIWVGNGVF